MQRVTIFKNQFHMNECPCILCTLQGRHGQGPYVLDQFRIMKAFLCLSRIGINNQKFAAKAHSSRIIELLNIQYEDNPCISTLDVVHQQL